VISVLCGAELRSGRAGKRQAGGNMTKVLSCINYDDLDKVQNSSMAGA